MYPVSARFKTLIKRITVAYDWHGLITDKEGNEYELEPANFVKGAGKLTRRCSGSTELSIGTTCAAELDLKLYLDVDRYVLFGGTVELFFTLYDLENDTTEDVPMGIFTISECNQSSGQLSILAYDNMTKFDDVHFSPLNHTITSPYDILVEMCTICGVELGATIADINGLANGSRDTGFADVVGSAKTWKDVLGYLGAYLGAFAYIGRDGKLYFGRYTSVSDDVIPPSFRYSSDFSDFRTTYDGLYGTYKGDGVQEYVSNSNTGGLVLDLGTNPFLQFTDQTNRLNALQEIIDMWNGVYYVPYKVSMPLVPYYDPGDVLAFTGNQAAQYDIGAITEIVFTLGGKQTVKCTGDNPRLAETQDRFTKTVAGLSKEYNNGQEVGTKNFWMLFTKNTSTISLTDNVKTQIAEIEFKQITDVQKVALMFTCELHLSDTATVEVLQTIDDEEDYSFLTKEEKLGKGKRIISVTCAFRVVDKITHTAKVYLKIHETPLLWNDIG